MAANPPDLDRLLADHLENEEEQLARIDRMLDRVADSVDRLVHVLLPLLLGLAVISTFALWALLQLTDRSDSRTIEQTELEYIICRYVLAGVVLDADSEAFCAGTRSAFADPQSKENP